MRFGNLNIRNQEDKIKIVKVKKGGNKMKVDLEKLRADVLGTIVEVTGLKVEEVTVEFNLKDEDKIDSLDLIEIAMDIENKYNVEISDEDSEKITTAEELIAYVYAKLEKEEPTTKTDEEILELEEDQLTEEEKVRKVELIKVIKEDAVLAKPETELTEEEKVLVKTIKESREKK